MTRNMRQLYTFQLKIARTCSRLPSKSTRLGGMTIVPTFSTRRTKKLQELSATVKRRTPHVQKIGDVLAGLVLFDQLSGMVDLPGGEFHPPAKLHAWAPGGFYSGAVRSVMRHLSNSANTRIIRHMAQHAGVAVSIAWVSEWNFTPGARMSSSIVVRLRKLRPSLSSFQTMSVSPGRSVPRQHARAGRLLAAPDNPLSP
jgi:hypothetical protein